MSQIATLRASFHSESWAVDAGYTRVLVECMDAYAKMRESGSSKDAGIAFDPDMKVMAILVKQGVFRFVTARINGEIVAQQNWLFVDDVLSRNNRVAHMTGIWKRDKLVCDTAEFIRFGIAAMKAAGGTQVVLSAYAARPGLREAMEAAGCRVVEFILEA